MNYFIGWLFNSFYDIIYDLSSHTIDFISGILEEAGSGSNLYSLNINLVLFSETPILQINAYDLILLFFSIFYTFIFIVCVWKIIKKVVVKITGWKRW